MVERCWLLFECADDIQLQTQHPFSSSSCLVCSLERQISAPDLIAKYDLFLEAVFFAAAALTAGFLRGCFWLRSWFCSGLCHWFLLSAFRVPLANFTPASLARLLKLLLRRAAVRFSSMFFLTAVSIALWVSPSVAADGLASKASWRP